jgi:hypothetical protein
MSNNISFFKKTEVQIYVLWATGTYWEIIWIQCIHVSQCLVLQHSGLDWWLRICSSRGGAMYQNRMPLQAAD